MNQAICMLCTIELNDTIDAWLYSWTTKSQVLRTIKVCPALETLSPRNNWSILGCINCRSRICCVKGRYLRLTYILCCIPSIFWVIICYLYILIANHGCKSICSKTFNIDKNTIKWFHIYSDSLISCFWSHLLRLIVAIDQIYTCNRWLFYIQSKSAKSLICVVISI